MMTNRQVYDLLLDYAVFFIGVVVGPSKGTPPTPNLEHQVTIASSCFGVAEVDKIC